MRLAAYLNPLLDALDNFPYLESREIKIDERPPDAAYTKGAVTFIDGSRLTLKEFVIFTVSSTDVVKYGYHYANSAAS